MSVVGWTDWDALCDTFSGFAATDNHIGFMEKDPVRFNDSLEAFEEILKVAKSQDVSETAIRSLSSL